MEGNPKLVSVVMATLRKDPGFAMLCDSLARCARILKFVTGVDIELVCVDGRLWYDDEYTRRQELKDAVAGRFAFTHVPPKPTRWQGPYRYTSKDLWAKANASNTGIVYAEGASVVFTDDCSLFDEEWLLWHFRAATQGLASCGGYKYVFAGTSEVVDGQLVRGKIEEPGDHRLHLYEVPGAVASGGHFYGGNCAAPLDTILKVDGYDELMDGQGGLEDCEFGCRVIRAAPMWFFPGACIYQLQESHEPVGAFLGSHGRPCQNCEHKHGEHNQYAPRECQADLCTCPEFKDVPDKRCKGFPYWDGKIIHHFSQNHRPIHRLHASRFVKRLEGYYEVQHDPKLIVELGRMVPLGNQYKLSDLRSKVRRGEPLPVPPGPKRDWRDNQLLEDM